MTDLLTPNQYMDLLLARRAAHEARHGRRPGFPALLDWFIEPGDEDLVDMATLVPAQRVETKRPTRPRRYRPASYWRDRLERITARMERINGTTRHETTDRAAHTGIGIRQTGRQARRYGETIDRVSGEYVRLEKQRGHAVRMLRAAEASEP